ncbi:MAG: hypothetical protein ACK5B4_11445, partial [Bacteroidota bacterium]
MKQMLLFISIAFTSLCTTAQYKSENIFYMTDTPESFESFIKNLRHISMVCPQTFLISREGVLSGSMDRRVIDSARKYRIKLVPL